MYIETVGKVKKMIKVFDISWKEQRVSDDTYFKPFE